MEPGIGRGSTIDEYLTVLLLPSGDVGERLLDNARRWSRLNLLKRSIWVVPEGVNIEVSGPVSAAGLLLWSEQESEVDVFHMLGSADTGDVQLVVLQSINADTVVDRQQVECGQALFKAMQAAIPRPLHPDSGAQFGLVALNVIAAPTGVSGVDAPTCLLHQFTANLVVSPEDRRSTTAIDNFVRPGDSHLSWALAHATAISGIWSGMTVSAWAALSRIEDRTTFGSAQSTQVTPFRAFARCVSSASMTRKSVTETMQSLTHTTVNITADLGVPVASDPEPVISQVLHELDSVDEAAISYQTPVASPAPRPKRIGFFAAIAVFLRFSGGLIAGSPRYFARRVRLIFGIRSTEFLEGNAGSEEIVFEGGDATLREIANSIQETAQANVLNLAALQTENPAPTPTLWRSVRGAVFALLDGSPMPTDLSPPSQNGHRVVVDSLPVVVPPPDPWQSTVAEPSSLSERHGLSSWLVTPCSPRDFENARASLESAQSSASDERATLEERLAALAHPPAANTVSDPASGDSNEPSKAQRAAIKKVEAELKRLRTSIKQLNQLDRVLADNVRSLEDWHKRRDSSLLWRLAATIHQRAILAEDDAKKSYEEATSLPKLDLSEPTKIRSQFSLRFMIWAATLVLVIVGGYYVPTLAWPIETIGIMLGVLLLMLISSYRRHARFIAAVILIQHEHRDAARRFRESRIAAQRLNACYEQIIEWGQILSDVSYEPWILSSSVSSSFDDDLREPQLPTSVGLAIPDPADVQATQLVTSAALRTIAASGWRTRAFQALEVMSLRERLGVNDPDIEEVDRDSPSAPNGSRAHLLRSLLADRNKEAVGLAVMRASIEHLYQVELSVISHRVQVVNGQVAPEETHILGADNQLRLASPEWSQYLEEVLSTESQMSNYLWSTAGKSDQRARQTITTLVWKPDRELAVSESSVKHRGLSKPAAKNRGVEQSVRIDFGPAVDHAHLFVFSTEASPLRIDEHPLPPKFDQHPTDDIRFWE